MKTAILILGLSFTFFQLGQSQTLYKQNNGYIHFRSDAPLEIIQASSRKLRGVINLEERTFAFSVSTYSFEGFNHSLQKDHFHENYMESKKYPQIYFTGKIIEDIDLQKNGTYHISGKGKLVIHGVEQERIIQAKLLVRKDRISIASSFSVPLADHNVRIPKIVFQKIAETIQVKMKATLFNSSKKEKRYKQLQAHHTN